VGTAASGTATARSDDVADARVRVKREQRLKSGLNRYWYVLVNKGVICISEFPDIRESRIASRPNRYIPGYPPAYPGIPG